jgi:hypothetical protein
LSGVLEVNGKGLKRGWVVLACGKPLDEASLERRDTVRDELRREVAEKGFVPREHVWVWDETNRAQLVLGTFESRDLAESYALSLQASGLCLRVIRDFDEK